MERDEGGGKSKGRVGAKNNSIWDLDRSDSRLGKSRNVSFYTYDFFPLGKYKLIFKFWHIFPFVHQTLMPSQS